MPPLIVIFGAAAALYFFSQKEKEKKILAHQGGDAVKSDLARLATINPVSYQAVIAMTLGAPDKTKLFGAATVLAAQGFPALANDLLAKAHSLP